jgi:hypothetical protein
LIKKIANFNKHAWGFDERFNNFLTLKVWQLNYLSYLYYVINKRDMKNEKIKIQIQNEIYELPVKSLRNWSGKQLIYVSHAEASLLVRQFMKKFFPEYVVKVSSNSFAGGNSLDVYVCTKLGGQVNEVDFKQISSFANMWEYGRFDGMTDCYEHYDNSGATTDNGNEVEAGVKYVHVNNRPRFGTVEAILNEVLNEGRMYSEVVKYYTDASSRPAAAKAWDVLQKMVG